MQTAVWSMLDPYCLAFFIISVTTLPTSPILQGPWNLQVTPLLSPVSISSSTASSSSPSSSFSAALNSSSSLRLTSSSSRSLPLQSNLSTSPPNPVKTRPSNIRGSESLSSTIIRFSTSFSGSAGESSARAKIQKTGFSISFSSINTQPNDLNLVSTSILVAIRSSSSSGSDGGRPPFPTSTKGHVSLASSLGTQPPYPSRNSGVPGPIASISSLLGTSLSSVTTTGVFSTTVPSISSTNASRVSVTSPVLDACGTVAQYYDPTPKDWTNYNTDNWLNIWVGNNVDPIAANANGFTGAFASWAVGNVDFSCRDDGSPTDCDFNPCNIPMLNDKGVDVRPAYYVMESLVRIHTYFTGLREAFTVSAIGAALSKDGWAETFYRDKDDKSVIALREVLNVLTMIVGIVSTLSSLAGPVAGTIAAISASVYAGAAGSVTPTLGTHVDDTFKKSADLGGILGSIVVGAIESFTSANNILMHGQNYLGTGDLRDYFRGGAFVNYSGVDKNAVTNTMNGLLIGQAINQLYRQQKIFILGGGACGDNQGIGHGPQVYSVCRNGQAWYLYYWQENDVISLTMHQWGWVSPPPGADRLGQGDFAAVTVQDIINSSLDAYNVAEYDYNNVTAYQRAESAITKQWANPAGQGPAWEGIFTIPVCDISATVNSNYYDKAWILEDYGHDSRPVWCGPICNGDVQKTRNFIHAANMDNFKSPRHLCDDDSEGKWWSPRP